MLSVRLDPDIERRLSDLARRTGRTKSFYARELIEGNMEDLEDRYLAEARLEKRNAKRRPSLTSRQVRKGLVYFLPFVLFAFSCEAFAQFGGHPGDVVLYALTAKGSGVFQVGPTNPGVQVDASRFKTVDPETIPVEKVEPFPLFRRVLFEEDDALFELLTGQEGVPGLHRMWLAPVKVFDIDGIISPFSNLVSTANTYISFPAGLDLVGDIEFQTLKLILWSPHHSPIIAPTNERGSVGPPNISGFEYLFATPGLIKIPALMPWTGLRRLYPDAGWSDGVDLKLLDQDPVAGNTTRILRLHPAKSTPPFRILGDTHLFILQGSVNLTVNNSSTVSLRQGIYAFVPANLTIQVSNPKQYDGPGSQPNP